MDDRSGAPNYERLFDAAPGNYLVLDPDFRIAGVTEAYLSVTRTARADVIGRKLFDVFPDNPNDPAADGVRNLRASLTRVLETKRPDRMPVQKYDIRVPESEGGGFEERYWSPLNTPVLKVDGSVDYIIHWVEDVTELVRLKTQLGRDSDSTEDSTSVASGDSTFLRTAALDATKRLTESERRYRFLADSVPQLIWTADQQGAIDYGNAQWPAFTGRSLAELRGDRWFDIVHPDDRARTIEAWTSAVETAAGRFEIEHRLRRHDGAWRWMLTMASPYRDGAIQRWFGSTTDVHERVIAAEHMRAAQQLQAVGQLAGGMAHEVNNMMSAVLGFGELVAMALGPQHPQRSDVDEIIKAGTRAAHVSRQLLAFSRQQVLRPTIIDLNVVINELVPVLRRLLGSDRRLDIRTPHMPLRVLADRGQLEQVLINLVANARDATSTNGVVGLEAELAQFDPQSGAPNEESSEAGPFVRLTVRDDGVGMAPDTVSRVFEPFFTTKSVGAGTGLGLSMVYGIVSQSGGHVRLESTLGAGTTVSIYLPRATGDSDAATDQLPPRRGQGERVLVVEDEPMVRSLARRALEAAGYVVYQAPNGAAALEFLTMQPGAIDLILTDVVMPNMNGVQLAENLMRNGSRIPILFMSAYSGEDIAKRGLSLTGATWVHKPFTLEALAMAVRNRLDHANSSSPSA
jgi:PAS domain S-box-containing protein